MNHFTPKRLIGYALAIAFLLVAGWSGSGVLRNVQEWLWLQTAVKVDAQILSYKHSYGGIGKTRHRLTTFSYAYSLSGQRYQRTIRHLGPFVDHRAEADRIISAATGGRVVPCYVDAKNPGNALLARTPSPRRVGIEIAFTAGFALASGLLLYGCLSKRYAHQF